MRRPGLCILEMSRLSGREELIRFGRRAKGEVLTKAEAYDLAGRYGIRLSEHGGSGDGVIGALAGCALRLEGRDGRFRGQLEGLETGTSYPCDTLREHPGIDRVASLQPSAGLDELQPISKDAFPAVEIIDKPKTILYGGESLFLICPREGDHVTNWSRSELKRF